MKTPPRLIGWPRSTMEKAIMHQARSTRRPPSITLVRRTKPRRRLTKNLDNRSNLQLEYTLRWPSRWPYRIWPPGVLLALVGAVGVLQPLYTSVLVPQTVAGELQQADMPDAVRTWIAQPPDWCEIRPGPTFRSSPPVSRSRRTRGDHTRAVARCRPPPDRRVGRARRSRTPAPVRHRYLGHPGRGPSTRTARFWGGAHAASSDELLYVGGTRQPRPSAAIDRERGSVIVGRELGISLVVNSDTGSLSQFLPRNGAVLIGEQVLPFRLEKQGFDRKIEPSVLFQEDESGCLEWEHPPDRLDDTDVAFAVDWRIFGKCDVQ